MVGQLQAIADPVAALVAPEPGLDLVNLIGGSTGLKQDILKRGVAATATNCHQQATAAQVHLAQIVRSLFHNGRMVRSEIEGKVR